MKVAVSSQGRDISSPVDERFARAPFFVIVDTESGEAHAVDNAQNMNAAQGAGVQAAATVVAQDVEAVITVHCGPKAFRAMRAAEIKIYCGAEGTVADAITKLKSGDLQEADDADVEGHWV